MKSFSIESFYQWDAYISMSETSIHWPALLLLLGMIYVECRSTNTIALEVKNHLQEKTTLNLPPDSEAASHWHRVSLKQSQQGRILVPETEN